MSHDWTDEHPTWADAPAGWDPERDRKWSRAWIRPQRPGWRWLIRLRRRVALWCVRAADKLQP